MSPSSNFNALRGHKVTPHCYSDRLSLLHLNSHGSFDLQLLILAILGSRECCSTFFLQNDTPIESQRVGVRSTIPIPLLLWCCLQEPIFSPDSRGTYHFSVKTCGGVSLGLKDVILVGLVKLCRVEDSITCAVFSRPGKVGKVLSQTTQLALPARWWVFLGQ